jgi:predicted nuclease of predicted toxin-antitoxin system
MLAILLLDENTSPRIVNRLWEKGIDAEHIRNRNMLQAADHEIWHLAASEQRTIVTINGKDFRRLAQSSDSHHGIIVIPSGRNADGQFELIMTAVTWVTQSNSQSGFSNRYIEVGDNGEIVLAEIACREGD